MTTKLWKQEQAWSKLSAKELKTLEEYCADYVEFVSRAKTERLAHDLALAMAKKAGFVNIDDVKSRTTCVHYFCAALGGILEHLFLQSRWQTVQCDFRFCQFQWQRIP